MKAQDIHDMLGIPARLAIVTTLAASQRLSFSELKAATGLADGNLHVQAHKLRDAGFLVADKGRRQRRQVTCFQLTDAGLESLRALIIQLQEALERRLRTDAERREGDKDDAMVW